MLLKGHVTVHLSYLTIAVFAGASVCCGVKRQAGQRAASCCSSATLSSSFSLSSFRSSLTMSSSSINAHVQTLHQNAAKDFRGLPHSRKSALCSFRKKTLGRSLNFPAEVANALILTALRFPLPL